MFRFSLKNSSIDGTRHQPETTRIVAAVVSNVGNSRENNEDNFLIGDFINMSSSDHCDHTSMFNISLGSWHLFGVFDGMGGGEMGELASRDAAEAFLEAQAIIKQYSINEEIDSAVRAAFLEANNRIVARQKEHRVFGTTGTVLCTNGLLFKIYHLGDSRAYLYRDGTLLQLTRDQTLAQMKMEVGMYNEDDPSAEADKHKLTEYIGRDWTCKTIKPVESHWIPIEHGDFILLCSDGLYDMCSDRET